MAQLSPLAATEPLRLTYKLDLRSQHGAVIECSRKKDGQAIGENDLRRLGGGLHPIDQMITRELTAAAVFGVVSDSALARLVTLLAQRTATVDGRVLTVGEDTLSPRMRLEPVDSALGLRLYLATPKGEVLELDGGRLLAGPQAYFLVGTTAHPIEAPAPWELQPFVRNPVRPVDPLMSPAERDRLVKELMRLGVPQADLDSLAVRRAPPNAIVARVVPGKSHLIAHLVLEADYEGTHAAITGERPPSPYLTLTAGAGSEHALGIAERDLAAEESAKSALRPLGFRFDKNLGNWVALEDSALAALDAGKNPFPPTWRVERADDAPRFLRDLDLVTKVRFEAQRGFLDLDVSTRAVAEDAAVQALIEMKDLLKWLHSGRRYLALADGSFVAPSARFKKSLKIIDDMGVQAKRALVSPLCVGLLRALGETSAVAAADAATQEWLDELRENSTPREVEVPAGLVGNLRDYQKRGLDWLAMLHRHRLTGILADDMGLGKTVQALALLLLARDKDGPKPSLVIAPTSVISVWRDEAVRFAPGLRVLVWHGPPQKRRKVDLGTADLVVTSYGVLRRDAELLSNTDFRYVILDEAQSAKNAATQNAKAVRTLKSERRLALSGTPVENRPEELWSAFDFLAPGFLGGQRQFAKRYARPIDRGEEEPLAMLRARVAPLVLRRLKEDVAPELPPRQETIVRAEMSAAQRALYDHIAGRLKDSIQERIEAVGIERAQLDILAALTRLRQICCDPALLPNPGGARVPPSAKLELFAELLREALGSGRRIIVFSQFVEMQKRIIKTIEELGVKPLWLHGGTRDRKAVVDAFQDPSGPPVIVISLKAGGTGLTLTRADTVIHYDPWWNPAVERQATDRAHRLGQTQKVQVYKLICRDSVEEKVLELAADKAELADELLGKSAQAGKKRIDLEDVLALLG